MHESGEMNRDHTPVFVGIDGGGSSTRLLIIDEEGRTLKAVRSGPANPLVVGWDRAYASLDEVAQSWDEFGWTVVGLVAGLAGSDRVEVRAKWLQYFDKWSVEKFWLTGDYRIAWAALNHGQPGMIVIVGTGAIVYAESQYQAVRRGGYGWKFGDLGSGIWLGTEACKAALAQWEGAGEKSALTPMVCEQLQVTNPVELLEYWYGPRFDPRSAADLAKDVVQLAEFDAVAYGIVTRAARGLTRLMLSALEPLDWNCDPVGVTGGLAHALKPWLEREWWSCGRLEPLSAVRLEPVSGAAILAKLWTEQERKADGGTD